MSNNNVPAFDYRTGMGGAPYAGDFSSVIYDHKVVAGTNQPSVSRSEPPAQGDARPAGQRFHGGVVQPKSVYRY